MLEKTYQWFTHSRDLLYILVFVFVGVTYFTTLNGIIGYVFGSWESEAVSLLQLGLFAMVILGLQAYLLLRSTRQVIEFRQHRLLKNVVWFVLWAFTFLFSATFSYTFYYDLISADTHSDQVIKQGIHDVVGNAERYLSDFESAKAEMDTLATYSAATAVIENQRGGTCGDLSPPGDGPRIRYRRQEEKVFWAQAQQLSGLQTLVHSEMGRFKQHARDFESGKITKVAELQRVFNASIVRLNGYGADSPQVVGVLNQLQQHYRGNRNTGKLGRDGVAIRCPDPIIDKAIEGIKQRFAGLPAISPVTLFDRTDRRQLQNRVVDVFLSPFRAQTEQTQQFNRNDYIALGLGFLLEALMFLITLILHQGAKPYVTNKDGYIGEWFSSRDVRIFSERLSVDEGRLQAIDHKGHDLNTGFFLVVDADEVTDAVITVLEKQGLFTQQMKAVPVSTLPSGLQHFVPEGANRLVNTYYSPWYIWRDVRLSLSHLRTP